MEVEIHSFLTFAQDEVAVNFILWPHYPSGMECEVPLDKKLGGSHIRSGRLGEEKSLLKLPGYELGSSSP